MAEGAIRPGFTAISTCDLPKLASFASDTEADYIEVRRPGNGRLDGGAPQIEVVDTFGEPCRAATDVPSCLKRLDAESWGVVYTREYEVGALTQREDIARFFAPIDSLDEALFVFLWSSDSCPRAFRETPKGFEILVQFRIPGCDGYWANRTRVVRVNRDGSFTVVEDQSVKEADPSQHCFDHLT